jgi:hypothetical protein
MGLNIPLHDGLELPWRVGGLQQCLQDYPRVLEYLEAAHREVVLSPLLCGLVVDEIIARLNGVEFILKDI